MIINRGLIVSCQALQGNPLRHSESLAKMAKCAELGGAVAIRANGYDDITAMKKQVSIPIIGLNKLKDENGKVVITPSFAAAEEIAKAGADMIAMDFTDYPSSIRENPEGLIQRIHNELNLPVMADISTVSEAVFASNCGADLVSTTLAGYQPNAPYKPDEKYVPDLNLIREIMNSGIKCPLIAEGRFWRIEDINSAFELGVYGVVIGKAITNPIAITQYYTSQIHLGGAL